MEDEKKIKAAESVKENGRKTEEEVKKSADTPILAPGEKLFTVILLLTGIIAVILAVQLWQKVDGPKSSSAAAVPLFVAVVWAVLSFFMLLDNRKEKAPLDSLKSVGEKIKAGVDIPVGRRNIWRKHYLICL